MAWLSSAPLFCVFLHTVYVHAIPDKTVVCATSVKGKLKHEFYVKEVLVTHFITKRSRFRPFVCPTLIDGLRAMFFNPSSCWWLQTPDAVGILQRLSTQIRVHYVWRSGYFFRNYSTFDFDILTQATNQLACWVFSRTMVCFLFLFSYSQPVFFESLPWGTLRFANA